jgi:hypothetical protein
MKTHYPPIIGAALLGTTVLAGCGGSSSPTGGGSAGSVVAAKSCTLAAVGIPVPANQCWQLTYNTTDSAGEPVQTIATVLVPATAPRTGRVLVSYQTAEDGLTTACAPSTEFAKGTSIEEVNVLLDLAQGWVVVVPDYEGPESQYGAGHMAGHAVLDGVRAALRFTAAELDPGSKVALEGYSGGALASGWAMELQGSYAPELNIVGVAEGGIPADIHAIAKQVDGGPFSGIELAAAIGIKRAYQYRFDFESDLNTAGKAMEQNIGAMCVGQVGNAPDPLTTYPLQKLGTYTTIPDLLDDPPVAEILNELKMGQHKPAAASVFMFHSVVDEIIPIATVDALHAYYCAQGVNVIYERTLVGEHIAALAPFFLETLPYLQRVLSGAPPQIALAQPCS